MVIESQNSNLLVQLYDQTFGSSMGFGMPTGATDGKPHIWWGQYDNQPNAMKALIQRNNQVPAQLDAIRDLNYGSGLGFFKRQFTDDGMVKLTPYTDAKLDAWVRKTQINRYVVSAFNQYGELGNVFTKMAWDVNNNWWKMSVSDAFFTRIVQPAAGKSVTEYVYNPAFGANFGQIGQGQAAYFSAYDPEIGTENKKGAVRMFHSKDDRPGNPYYSYPSWWCASPWIELANLIPIFHQNGIQNGYNIKYVIKMPKDYFDKQGNRMLDQKIIDGKWSAWGENLQKWFTGAKNVNKTLVLRYLRGVDGKSLDNIEVVPLKNEMSDNAYSTVLEMANLSIANSMGILPTLAGVNPGKGNDSGSQIMVMANYQQFCRTGVSRQNTLLPLDFALADMGYTDVICAIKEIKLSTLDANPTGAAAVVNHGKA